MKTTNKFARQISATEIEFAPTLAVLDGQTIAINPESPDAAEIYARLSPPYLPYRDEPPTVEPPSYARPTGYETRDGIIRRVYEIVTPTPTVANYDAAMEDRLYYERCARGYTTREPDVYLNSQVPRWASDARDWIAHRDAVMLYALEIMNAVEAGTREPPTLDEFKAGLPKIEWSFAE